MTNFLSSKHLLNAQEKNGRGVFLLKQAAKDRVKHRMKRLPFDFSALKLKSPNDNSVLGMDDEMREHQRQSGDKVSPKKRRGRKKDLKNEFSHC